MDLKELLPISGIVIVATFEEATTRNDVVVEYTDGTVQALYNDGDNEDDDIEDYSSISDFESQNFIDEGEFEAEYILNPGLTEFAKEASDTIKAIYLKPF